MQWIAVTLSAYVAFIVAAVWMIRAAASVQDSAAPRSVTLSRLDLTFVAAIVLFIIVARLPILNLARDLQPDEAQYSANALMAESGWLNWDSLDSGSSGPMNSMIQAWPLVFGLDITFTTMHITGAILASVLASLVYLALRTEFGSPYGILFSLPTVLFLGATTYWDLVHTTSLYLPLSLATFGIFAAVRIWRRPNTPLAIAAAFALGLILITKLQGSLVGVFVGTALIIAHTRSETRWSGRVARALQLVIAAALPLILSLTPLIVAGHLRDFVTETLNYSAAYVGSPVNPLKWLLVIASIPMLAPLVVLLGATILICGALWLKTWRHSEPFTWFALGLAAIAALSIASSGQPHHHYLLFLAPTLPFAAAALSREVLTRRPTRWGLGRRQAGLLAAAVAILMLPSAVIEARGSYALRNDGVLSAAGMRFHSPHILQFLLPDAHDKLIVYGYMPYFYVLAGMPSGTRETENETVILNRKHADREAYRERFIAEMDQHRPAIFVDAVTFTDHVYRDPVKQGPRAFPALAERLDRDFVRVSRGALESGCPQTYLRRDRIARLSALEVGVATVSASGALRDEAGLYDPEHVVDRNVFESCIDRWLAPDASPAQLDLTLTRAENISRVALLNTRGRWREPDLSQWSYARNILGNVAEYHAARTAVVKLMRDETVIAEKQVTVDAYPYWTNVEFGNRQEAADHVMILFPDWEGHGPGLNEIAIYRAEEANTAALDE